LHPLNALPLQVTLAATVAIVLLALWASSGGGARAATRGAILALDRVTTALAALLACLALAIAVAAGLWQVVTRFALNQPSIWSEALVRMALIWMAYLGLAVALRIGALVSIDVAHRAARGALRRAFEAAALACSLSLMGVMLWFGWEMAKRVRFQEMAGLEVSMSWGYAAIPLGAAFAAIGAVAQFLDRRDAELDAAV
jgi:TRAP-type C4-dicarboxylate transport system permease small subunit